MTRTNAERQAAHRARQKEREDAGPIMDFVEHLQEEVVWLRSANESLRNELASVTGLVTGVVTELAGKLASTPAGFGGRPGETSAPTAPKSSTQRSRERRAALLATRNATDATPMQRDVQRVAVAVAPSLSSSPSSLSLSQSDSGNPESVSSSLSLSGDAREEPATRVQRTMQRNGVAHTGDVAGERYVATFDEPNDELIAVAEMVGVQDIKAAWLKFTGHYAGKWVHVAGAWQKWCATEAKHERVERERERERAKNSSAPLTADGLDPNSYEASQLRKKRKRAEEEAERAELRARLEAQKASAQ